MKRRPNPFYTQTKNRLRKTNKNFDFIAKKEISYKDKEPFPPFHPFILQTTSNRESRREPNICNTNIRRKNSDMAASINQACS